MSKNFIISQELAQEILNYMAARVNTEMKIIQGLQNLKSLELPTEKEAIVREAIVNDP